MQPENKTNGAHMNAAVLALLLLSVATAAGRNVTINRHNRGDVFAISGQ